MIIINFKFARVVAFDRALVCVKVDHILGAQLRIIFVAFSLIFGRRTLKKRIIETVLLSTHNIC